MQILAISLDLDDTLWPVEPAILAAERCLDEWLREHHPAVAAAWPIPAMRELRDATSRERPDLAHDFTAQRLLTIERAFATCGIGCEHVDAAFDIYYAARNRVDFYEDTLPALAVLSARVPLISISNGNADLERIGLRHHFATASRRATSASPSRTPRSSTPPASVWALRPSACCTSATIRDSMSPARAERACVRRG